MPKAADRRVSKGAKKPGKARAATSSPKPRKGSAVAANVGASPVKYRTITAPMIKVDAFTRRLFHGNPAAVVLLSREFLTSQVMQGIAAENNLSETAFVVVTARTGKQAKARIRWFTPTTEVNLCGHATLAAAHALWTTAKLKPATIVFDSASGKLTVQRRESMIVLDFPAHSVRRTGQSRHLAEALGRSPTEVYQTTSASGGADTAADAVILAVFENKRDVHELTPNFAKLRELDAPAVLVTAPGAGHDYVCRYFAPSHGLDEDPVTGSAQCVLVPYWAGRLGRTMLTCHQVSKRGGELVCELVSGREGGRVRIGGYAVTFAEGTCVIPVE